MNITMYIQGQIVKPFMEYKSMELELNFEDLDEVRASITSDKVTWVHESADMINNYLSAGLTGGLGVYWGMSLIIYAGTDLVFNGYIDLVNDAEFSCEKVITHIKEFKKEDWLEEVADGYSFDLLYRLGVIQSGADYIHTPYINNDIPDYKQAAMFFILAFVLINELVRYVKDIADIVADFSGVFNAGGAAIKLIFFIAYLIAQIIAIYALIKQMIAELIQPVRYHYSMLYFNHWVKLCSYLGLQFSSSIYMDSVPTNNELPPGLWANRAHMPIKTKRGYKKNESPGDERGHFDGTFGDFIRKEIEFFNAKIIIINGVLHFERRDFASATEIYKIPPVLKTVAPHPDYEFKGTNAGEIISNYLLEFEIDSLDLNTIDRYKGTNAKNFISSINSDPSGIELIKGFKQPNLGVALAKRKNVLTRVEEFFKDFLNVFDTLLSPVIVALNACITAISTAITFMNKIITALNKLPNVNIPSIPVPTASFNKPNFSDIIENRIGMMLLTHELTGKPKTFLIEGDGWDVKLTSDNETKLSAETIWNYYHYLESFVPSATRPAGNQTYIYEIPTIHFCIGDYYKIRGINNDNRGQAKVISPNNLPAKILSLRWNIWKDIASIRFAEERLYTTNLKQELIINQGQ